MTDEQTTEENEQPEVDAIEFGEQWLADVFERMNFNLDVSGEAKEDKLYFDVSGEDAEILLGVGTSAPKSIESIQTLLSAALSRVGDKRQVYVDVSGFRDQRAERLDSVAEELRDVATRLGKKVTIAGLNSYERSVVHKALEEDSSVKTESEGKGIFRKLSISPA
jgi:spoIIIJ-associated protein